jgi:hypothetical protein
MQSFSRSKPRWRCSARGLLIRVRVGFVFFFSISLVEDDCFRRSVIVRRDRLAKLFVFYRGVNTPASGLVVWANNLSPEGRNLASWSVASDLAGIVRM